MTTDDRNGRCESCRWWDRSDEHCELIEVYRPPTKLSACMATDDGKARLHTKPYFGCVSWEPKP